MKLKKFEIPQDGSGSPGHGNAIASADGGVGGLSKDLTATPSRQYDSSGLDPENLTAMEQANALTAIGLGMNPQVQSQGMGDNLDVGPFQDASSEGVNDGTSGGVGGVEDAGSGVGSFASEGEGAAIAIAVEANTKIEQGINLGRGLLNQELDSSAIAQSHPCPQRIFQMQLGRVRGIDWRSNAPLSPAARSHFQGISRHQANLQMVGQTKGSIETRSPRPND